MGYEYDALVLGSGEAALVAAATARGLGAKTAIIGGSEPSGAAPIIRLLASAAEIPHTAAMAAQLGISAGPGEVNFERLMAAVQSKLEEASPRRGSSAYLKARGIDFVPGTARLIDPHTVEVSGPASAQLTARFLFVEGRTEPIKPTVPGLEESAFHLPRDVFGIRDLPGSLVILGSDSAACELAQVFRRLGSDTTVVEAGAGILQHDDEEMSSMIQEALEDEGVRFVLSAGLTKVVSTGSGSILEIEQGGSVKNVSADKIIVSSGERTFVDSFGLTSLGAEIEEGRLVADNRCRTAIRNVFAIGGALGFTGSRMPYHSAAVAVSNAFGRSNARLDQRRQSWHTATNPGLAHVGSTRHDLHAAGIDFEYLRFPCVHVNRSILDRQAKGWMKVLIGRRDGLIHGLDYLDRNAHERVAGLAPLVAQGMTLHDLWEYVEPVGSLPGETLQHGRDSGARGLRRFLPAIGT